VCVWLTVYILLLFPEERRREGHRESRLLVRVNQYSIFFRQYRRANVWVRGWLTRVHLLCFVFVSLGEDLVQAIEAVGSSSGSTSAAVVIAKCKTPFFFVFCFSTAEGRRVCLAHSIYFSSFY